MPRIKARTKNTSPVKEIPEILIGADPELFAFNKEGELVSVHDILPGTKLNPLKVPHGGIQVDGIAGEFNINPAKSRTEWMRNLKHVRSLMDRILRNNNPNLYFSPVPTVFLSQEYMDSLPIMAKMLGCEPDFNAYTQSVQPKPDAASLFRTGAGHLHIGWTSGIEEPTELKHFQLCCDLTKELDFVLYNASLRWDTDTKRRELYGKPGSFRPKSYGLEYRVLSNAWLGQFGSTMYVHDAAKATAGLFFRGARPSMEFGKAPEDNWDDFYAYLEKIKIPNPQNYLHKV